MIVAIRSARVMSVLNCGGVGGPPRTYRNRGKAPDGSRRIRNIVSAIGLTPCG
jgi:hypothetical protein